MKSISIKILLTIFCMLIPLQLFNELIVFYNSGSRPIESFNTFSLWHMTLLHVYFKALLVLIFVWIANKKYSPKILMGKSTQSCIKALLIAIIVFGISKVLPHISSNATRATYVFEPIIPGLRNWFVVTFLTVGILESFRYKYKGTKIVFIYFVFYILYLYAGKFSLNLLPDPEHFANLKLSLFSAPENFFHWSYILPSTIVIYASIIYMRLGFIPAIFFTFAVGAMGMIYSAFNSSVLVDNSLLNNYLACIALSSLMFKYLKKTS